MKGHDMENLEAKIRSLVTDDGNNTWRQVTGENALMRDLFRLLVKEPAEDHNIIMLLTVRGFLIDTRPVTGYYLDMEKMKAIEELTAVEAGPDFLVAADAPGEELQSMASRLASLFSVCVRNKGRADHILDWFDHVDNPICVYDSEAFLLYANKSYCDSMHIASREEAVGKHILNITKQAGIRIKANATGTDKLKMMDVLKNGRKILDWEVNVEAEDSPNFAHLVSNNMYPVKDSAGKVEGMVEVAYTHHLDLNKTKKIMGLRAEYTFDSIVGESPVMKAAKDAAMEFAASPYNLLIVGESGAGKELFAQAVHNESGRRNGPFVAINCASLPENLIESELFGYVGGAFTGASRSGQIGKFELADGGTIFLDEIGELPIHFQAKLLRVLETRKVMRIGSNKETPVDVRVIAATNRNLEKMIEEGFFREDLYYRLQVLRLQIPPLRDRGKDIIRLTENFLGQAASMENGKPKRLSQAAEEALCEYSWPGNVRELRNTVYRISLLSKGETVTPEDVRAAISARGYSLKQTAPAEKEEKSPGQDPLAVLKKKIDSDYADLIREAIRQAGGSKTEAAKLLGVSRRTMYRMIEKYNV